MNRTVSIVFKSLYSCAHRCSFCHVLHVPRNVSYMTTEEVKATFDDIETTFAGMRVEMEMSGGEFTLRKDAVELIGYLRTKRINWSSLVLDTMAVPLADEHLARALGRLFSKANVSVHSPDADVHAKVSASRTRFEDLEAGITNLFRFFPAVFTNTSICAYNFDRLGDIAAFVLDARRARPETPLYCLYYLPVYREYGAAVRENAWRLPGSDNADLMPEASALPRVRAEFRRIQAMLASHGVSALLRDFNLAACLYSSVTGAFPENSFGLPNFMTDCYFIDYAHPIRERHTLEGVYSSIFRREKDKACDDCVASDVCPGIPSEWKRRGYQASPIDRAAYESQFPYQLLNRTLFSVFHDAVAMRAALAPLSIDWTVVAAELFRRLAGNSSGIESAREKIARASLADRVDSLVESLSAGRSPHELALIETVRKQVRSAAAEPHLQA